MTGRFFEDFEVGQILRHPTPRTVTDADVALYLSYTGDRHPLFCATPFAKALGFHAAPLPDLLTFHIVFGKTVGDVSQNAVANLGYSDVRFLRPVYPGATLRATSEVIGLREIGSGTAGIVYVTTTGEDEQGDVLSFHRWVLVNKRDPATPTGKNVVPMLPTEATDFAAAARPTLEAWDDVAWATGAARTLSDYDVGEKILHPVGMTIDEADHTGATRLYQNTARVHFDALGMKDSKVGQRLVYGGHIISVAFALSYPGLENVLNMAAWNAGTHANPTIAGDTLYAQTEILDKREAQGGVGLVRARLLAFKNTPPDGVEKPAWKEGKKKVYDPSVVLDLDYWGWMPA